MTDDTVTIAYFGASAFKITTARGKKILIDPYITENPLCREKLEYFYDADLVVVSHAAFDHMGNAIEIMKQSQAVMVCGGEVARHAEKMGIPKARVLTAVYGVQREVAGIRMKAVDARHSSRLVAGTEVDYGWPMGFVISTENDIRLYHTGDTALFGDLRLIGMLHRPHVMMIGVGGVSAIYAAEMDSRDAAMAALYVGPDVVLPMHYPAGSDAPAKFREALKVVAPNIEPVLVEPNSQIIYRKYKVS